MTQDTKQRAERNLGCVRQRGGRAWQLLLPGALLVAMGAELLAPLVLVDFGLTTFL